MNHRYAFPKKGPKLGNEKVTVNGIKFDSKREARRYGELVLLQRAGKISELELQKEYLLIPAVYEMLDTGEIYKVGAKKGQPKQKRVCVEQACTYRADFVYKLGGEVVVEDTKGCRDPSTASYALFAIKRKLMLHVHGIRIKEV